MNHDKVKARDSRTPAFENSAMPDQDGPGWSASDVEQLLRDSQHLRGLQWDEREDAAQAAAIRLWLKPPCGDPRKRLAYARRVLRHCASDRRRQRLHEQLLDEVTESQARPLRSHVRAELEHESKDVEGRLDAFRTRLTGLLVRVCDAVILHEVKLKPAACALRMQPCHVKSCRDAVYRRARNFGANWTPWQC